VAVAVAAFGWAWFRTGPAVHDPPAHAA
jgi:hypothetical protein